MVAAALGECVHVAGVSNFLRLAEDAGWQTVFLGPAGPVETVLAAAIEHGAALVGVSYRLSHPPALARVVTPVFSMPLSSRIILLPAARL